MMKERRAIIMEGGIPDMWDDIISGNPDSKMIFFKNIMANMERARVIETPSFIIFLSHLSAIFQAIKSPRGREMRKAR